MLQLHVSTGAALPPWVRSPRNVNCGPGSLRPWQLLLPSLSVVVVVVESSLCTALPLRVPLRTRHH